MVRKINASPRSISVNARAKLNSNCPPNINEKGVPVLINSKLLSLKCAVLKKKFAKLIR